MSILEDFVKFGGPGAKPARYGSRSGPGIVFIAKTAKKEGIFPQVIIGSISVIRILFPVALSQTKSCGFLFVTFRTVTLQYRLHKVGKAERIGAVNVGFDF